MELPRGIYFEFKPASGTTVLVRHTYLVFRDGKGGEWVCLNGQQEDGSVS